MKKVYETTIAAIAGVILICWVLVQFIYIPMCKDIKTLKSTMNQHKARNTRIKELASQDDFFEDLMHKVTSFHEEIINQLPRQIKLSSLLRELSTLARSSNLTIVSIKPIGTQPYTIADDDVMGDGTDSGYIKSDVQIIFECLYQDLELYVKSVENNELTIMTIKDIDVRIDREVTDSNTLHGTLTIEAYYRAG